MTIVLFGSGLSSNVCPGYPGASSAAERQPRADRARRGAQRRPHRGPVPAHGAAAGRSGRGVSRAAGRIFERYVARIPRPPAQTIPRLCALPGERFHSHLQDAGDRHCRVPSGPAGSGAADAQAESPLRPGDAGDRAAAGHTRMGSGPDGRGTPGAIGTHAARRLEPARPLRRRRRSNRLSFGRLC